MSARLRVHISPVGFDFHRVTEPLIKKQADKVYFVTFRKGDPAEKFLQAVLGELRSKYGHIEDKYVYVDMWNYYDCVEKYRQIILEENEKGNHVYVNVSTGTKITAMVGMIACMLWGATPYYARVSYLKNKEPEVPLSEFVQEPEELPVYDILQPKHEILVVLTLLEKAGGKMRKAEIIQELQKVGLIRAIDPSTKTDFSPTAKHSQLRAIIDPMESEWKYVRVEARGRRSDVFLTDQGKTALRIFGPSRSTLSTHRRWDN
jgi:hypothetical protein